jgi:hypothetical protein
LAGNCSAVGFYTDSSGQSQGLLLREVGGRWGSGVEATLPPDAGSKPNAYLGSVACASAGDCSAVGNYDDSLGRSHGLLLSEVAGRWGKGVEASLPANAGSSPYVFLSSIACPSAGNCAAVGQYNDSSGHTQGLLLSETAGKWARGVEATKPAVTGSFVMGMSLESVACASVGNCTAVGNYDDSFGQAQGLLLSETSGQWVRGNKASLPAGGNNARLVSVACSSAGNCSAVGNYRNSSGQQRGVLLSETSGKWAGGVDATPPRGAPSNGGVTVNSVACPATGDCNAVGQYTAGGWRGVLFGTLAKT